MTTLIASIFIFYGTNIIITQMKEPTEGVVGSDFIDGEILSYWFNLCGHFLVT